MPFPIISRFNIYPKNAFPKNQSGPKRYKYNPEKSEWVNTRDEVPLIETLRKEVEELFEVQFDFSNPIRED